MIRAIVNYITKPPPIPTAYLDGALYCGIAFFGALAAGFGSDEAAKYVAPAMLFWLRTACGVSSATLLALKMFRSTAFADHKNSQAAQLSEIPPVEPKEKQTQL